MIWGIIFLTIAWALSPKIALGLIVLAIICYLFKNNLSELKMVITVGAVIVGVILAIVNFFLI